MYERLSTVFAGLFLLTIAAAPASAQEFPFTGTVTADAVQLRAGAGQNYYVVGPVAKGTLLKVHDNLYGWYKVEPPTGTYSYISKDFVKVAADGSTGTVAGQRVRVRAPSPGGPDKSYRTQLMLNDGDTVQVIGESGAFYKIAPPADARLFVKADFVRKATADELAAAAKPVTPVTPEQPPLTPETPDAPDTPDAPEAIDVAVQPDGSAVILGETYTGDELAAAFKTLKTRGTPLTIRADKSVPYATLVAVVDKAKAAQITEYSLVAVNTTPPVPVPPVTPETPDKPIATVPETPDTPDKPIATVPETPETPATPDKPKTAAESAQLAELEHRYADLGKQDVVDQPIAKLKMDYEKLLANEDLSDRDRQIASARVETLVTRQELQDSLKEIAAVRAQLADAKQRDEEIEATRPKSYVAVGRLVASTLYTGEKLPLLHRVVDPLTGLTIAYVRPAADTSIRNLLGQYVGVMGRKEYDPALKLHIIDAESIDALTPQGR